MKKEFQSLSWLVKNFDFNKQVIIDYDVLKYREEQIKKMKKKAATKAEFAEMLRGEFQWQYWSRAEYELIIEIDDGRVWLMPWVGCREPDKVRIDVTDDKSFDWRGLAETYLGNQTYKNEAKIDVFNQLEYVWDEFVTYLWTTRLKYERKNPKFDN